jgi:hypothetical protein
LLDEFLERVLAGQLEQMQEELKESTFVTTSNQVEKNVRNDIEQSRQRIESEISKVHDGLSERKGFTGWMRDLATNFFVNMLTIIVIGVIAIGVAKIDAMSAYLKQIIENLAK